MTKKMQLEEKLNLQSYRITKILGNGTFGQVLLVEDINTKKQYACKVLYNEIFRDENQGSYPPIMTTIFEAQYPSILSIDKYSFTDFYNDNHLTMLTDYMKEGNLYQVLVDKQKILTKTQKYIIILGIALGCGYLHSKNIMHCNLNPYNILLDEHYYPYVSDFGLPQITGRKFIRYNSPIYLAPEIIEEKEYDNKVDIYSYGLIFYHIFTKFDQTVELPIYKKLESIVNGHRPDLKHINDENIKILLTKCWSKNPIDRPSFNQIVKTLTDPKFYSKLDIDYSAVTDYLQRFDLSSEQLDEKDDSQIELKTMKICGDNSSMQLCQASNNQTTEQKGFICPSITSELDLNSLLCISSYNNATVVINKEQIIQLIGKNFGQVTQPIKCTDYKELTEFRLVGKIVTYTPISCVCGATYTLYIGKNYKSESTLIYCSSKIRSGNTELWIGNSYPVALFGGCKNSAAIDIDGGIIFISENISGYIKSKLEPSLLPNGEKAIFVACCNEAIFVLNENGRVYKSSAKKNLSFHLVDELNDIVQLSGTCNHCLAVSRDGKVFGWGVNDSGCLGIGNESDKFVKFTLINSLCDYNIANAYAGSSHSLFQTVDGKLLSCGKNKFGQLFLDDLSNEEVLSPVETTIKSGVSFCIAGENTSFVFINGLPPNCPNQKVKF